MIKNNKFGIVFTQSLSRLKNDNIVRIMIRLNNNSPQESTYHMGYFRGNSKCKDIYGGTPVGEMDYYETNLPIGYSKKDLEDRLLSFFKIVRKQQVTKMNKLKKLIDYSENFIKKEEPVKKIRAKRRKKTLPTIEV